MTKFSHAKAEAAHQMKKEIIARQDKVSDLREKFAAEAKRLRITTAAMNQKWMAVGLKYSLSLAAVDAAAIKLLDEAIAAAETAIAALSAPATDSTQAAA